MPLSTSAFYPNEDPPPFAPFSSRRSVVHSTKGIVSSTQPLASQYRLEVLRKGGNCADAAVAVAAGLNMTEPGSTGIGGNMFCLFYEAKTKKVHALNGSGRAGNNCTLDVIRKDLGLRKGEKSTIPIDSVHAITIPGAAAGWVNTVERFGSGKVSMEEILAPAIDLGEQSFSVSELMGYYISHPVRYLYKADANSFKWLQSESMLRRVLPNGAEMLKKDPKAKNSCRAPRPGEIIKNPTLANTFRTLAKEGRASFYSGRIAEELIKVTQDLGSHLTRTI